MIEAHGKSRRIHELSTLWDAVSCCAFVTAVCRRVNASFANSSSPFSTAISARRYQSSAILSVCSLELKAATSSETTEGEAAKGQMHQHMFFLNKYYIWYLSIQWLGQDLNMFNHVQSLPSKHFNRSPSPSGSGVSSVLQGPWSIAASAMTATIVNHCHPAAFLLVLLPYWWKCHNSYCCYHSDHQCDYSYWTGYDQNIQAPYKKGQSVFLRCPLSECLWNFKLQNTPKFGVQIWWSPTLGTPTVKNMDHHH